MVGDYTCGAALCETQHVISHKPHDCMLQWRGEKVEMYNNCGPLAVAHELIILAYNSFWQRDSYGTIIERLGWHHFVLTAQGSLPVCWSLANSQCTFWQSKPF